MKQISTLTNNESTSGYELIIEGFTCFLQFSEGTNLVVPRRVQKIHEIQDFLMVETIVFSQYFNPMNIKSFHKIQPGFWAKSQILTGAI